MTKDNKNDRKDGIDHKNLGQTELITITLRVILKKKK